MEALICVLSSSKSIRQVTCSLSRIPVFLPEKKIDGGCLLMGVWIFFFRALKRLYNSFVVMVPQSCERAQIRGIVRFQ